MRTYKDGVDETWGEHVWRPIIEELYRITKPGGVVVWVVADATIDGGETGSSFKQALHFKECNFRIHDSMIYEKAGINFPDSVRYYSCFEYMFVFSKGRPKTINLIKDRPNKYAGAKIARPSGERNVDGSMRPNSAYKLDKDREIQAFGVRRNIWRYATGKYNTTSDEVAFGHPAVFPESLAQDHIISWSVEGDLIFDPFGGSGTTGIMAAINNRDFIMCDISDAYCEIMEERFSNRLGMDIEVVTL